MYTALVDTPQQFLVWPPDQPPPHGWSEAGASERETACLACVERASAEREEQAHIAALRNGSEAAFVKLVTRYQPALIRLALSYVRDRGIAEEVAQETWLAVLRSLERFEGRSSLKNWIFAILVNCARSRARKEQRTIPFTVAQDVESADSPERFSGPDDQWAGGWVSVPRHWSDTPDDRLLAREVRERIRTVMDQLPANQREVVFLRDVQGLNSNEVCEVLGISQVNQRVLLHRARSCLRQALEDYFVED